MPNSNFLRRRVPVPDVGPARRRASARHWQRTLAMLRRPGWLAGRHLVCLLCLLCLFGPWRGALAIGPERWSALTHTAFQHHTNQDTSGILCFAQDRQGFLWIGTQSGLLRWDGYRVRRFLADAAREDSLPDSYIMSLHVDSRGQLWAGTSSGGLVRYDAERDSFVRHHSARPGPGNGRVTALADDGAGGLWVGTGSGLDHMNAAGTLRAGAGLAPVAQAALWRGIDALQRDSDGTLWIGSRSGLFRLAPGAAAPLAVALAGRRGAVAIDALYRDSSGRLWIGTANNGAFVIEPGAAGASAVQESGPAPTLQHGRVATITEAARGEIWLGTEGADGGIVAVDPLLGSTRRIRHQPDTPDSLNDNDVLALIRERSGVVYVGSMAGLSQHDPQPHAITTIRQPGPAARVQLTVPSMMEHDDGRLWLGVAGGALDIIDPASGALQRLAPDPKGALNALPKGRVLALAQAADGKVYLGTHQGLYRANADGRGIVRLRLPGRAADAPVWSLAMDGPTLWLGGLDGLWQLAPGPRDSLGLLRHEDKALGDQRVSALLAVKDGLWVGTRAGLHRLGRGAGAVLETVATSATAADQLPPGYVSSLLEDRQGRLWVSIFGTGVAVLERTDADGRQRFRRIGPPQGLDDRGVNKLLEAADGAVWASTDDGLARIDPRSFAVRMVGAADGVHISNYWTNSGVVTAYGELVFGGLSGLTVVQPERLATWHYAPPVVATRLLLNDRELPTGPYNSGAGRQAPPIIITPAQRARGFSLEFAALDYSSPEHNRYAYRLQGYDHDWIGSDAATRRVSYTNLPPGNFVLQLRGSNRNGEWAPALEVPVRVLPAWHQRPAARLAAALLALAALAALVHLRTAFLRRRQRELQAMVEARTAELRDTQSQLEKLAYGDPLTGLANRRLFNDELRHLVAQAERGGAPCTLLLIDLDHSKQINAPLGHDAGHAMLAACAVRLLAAVRGADRPFRLGGDEFAVLLSQAGDQQTLTPVCQRILHDLAAPLTHDGHLMRISASVGAAVYHGGTHEQLYKQADLALYRAKAAGRNTWRLAGDDAP